MHHVTVEEGSLRSGQPVELTVDHARRGAIRANHSATHLLARIASGSCLADHSGAEGLAGRTRAGCRFDISHPKPMSDEELAQVERLTNALVLQNAPGYHQADGGWGTRGDRSPARAPCSARK